MISQTNQTTSGSDFSHFPAYAGVIDYVRKNPGARPRMIAEATDACLATTRKRLLRLQAEGILRAERYPKALCFFINTPRR